MRRNEAKTDTARPGARLIACVALMAAPAVAGDRALIDFVGYSEDGRYFAFEEFGIQDGSGFPYSSIYVVDLPADKWLPGTPVRVVMENEAASQAAARAEALEQAAATLDELAITAPADLIALNGDGEPGDGLSLDFGAVGYLPGDLNGRYTLSLEIFDAASPEDCVTFLGEEPKGYALLLEGEGESRELHRDAGMLPRSRGCPMTYRIYGVAARPQSASLTGAVAIVAVYPFGFEGPDRRFLAVPLGE